MKHKGTAWYVFKMPPGHKTPYEVDTRDGKAPESGGQPIAGPYTGPTGFHIAFTVALERIKEETNYNDH